jgi:hypothetical protein
MAENIVQSLFGFTPQAVQEQMYQTGEDRAMQLARLSAVRGGAPGAVFYGLKSAERAAATPLFGPSPQVQRAGNLQSIIQGVQASGVDLSQPEGLIELANAVGQNPEFGGIAASLRQEATRMTQQSALTSAKIFKETAAGTASLAQAMREKTPAVLDQARTTVLQLAGKTDLSPQEQTALANAREVLKLASPGQTISVGAKAEETEEAREVGRGAGQQFTKVTTTDLDASEKRMNSIRELQVLSGQVDTGAFAEVKAKAQSLFKDLGINIGDPTNAQTLRAAIERGVAQSQLEQKGVQTDRDAARYRTANVLLTNTPLANQYIVDYQMALTERSREKARFFQNFRTTKGTSVGAEGAWQEEIRNKDIFDSPTLSKYKDTFKMNDLAKRVKEGKASDSEKKELAGLMRQYGLSQVKIAQ